MTRTLITIAVLVALVTVVGLSRAQTPQATVGPPAAVLTEPDRAARTEPFRAELVSCDVSAKEWAADAWELDVLTLTNRFRAQNGLAPLVWDSTAARAAAWKAIDIPGQVTRTGFLSHDDDQPPRTFAQRIRDCAVSGYPTVGEVIAYGYGSSQEVVDAWIASPSHNANMLRDWSSAGVGWSNAAWVIVFSGAAGDGDTSGGDEETPTPTRTATQQPTATATIAPTRTSIPPPTPTPAPSSCQRPNVGTEWCETLFNLPDPAITVQRWQHVAIQGAWFILINARTGEQIGKFTFCDLAGACWVLE